MNLLGSFCVLLLFLSCSTKNNEKRDGKIVPIDLDDSREAFYSEKYESIDYLLLDIPEEVPLVRPFKVMFKNEKIYVQDREMSNLLIFDEDGNYLDIIPSSGVGPGEFYFIDDFQATHHNIFIQDAYLKKFLSYDLDGNFLNETKSRDQGYNFYKMDDFVLHYFANTPWEKPFSFRRLERDDDIVYIPTEKELKGINYVSINGFMEDVENGSIVFKMYPAYEIVIFDENGYLVESIEFDLGKYTFPKRKRAELSFHPERYTYMEKENLVENISAFFPFKNQYFMMLSQQGIPPTYLFLNKDFEVILQTNKFENDLDGMDIQFLPWTFNDNQLIYLINSRSFYKEYNRVFPKKRITLRLIRVFILSLKRTQTSY